MGHAYIAVGDKFCRILAVMTAPEGVQPLEPHLTAAGRRGDGPVDAGKNRGGQGPDRGHGRFRAQGSS
jgi:hypothetical protein